MRLFRIFATAAGMAFSVCVAVYSASANDSNSAIGAGGLEQVKSSAIRMVSEDLHISASKIRVRYLFRNLSDREQKVTVAFPMDFEPGFHGGDRIPGRDDEAVIARAVSELDFSVRVDGKPVTVESRIMTSIDRQGRDITGRLRDLGFAQKLIPPGVLREGKTPELDQEQLDR